MLRTDVAIVVIGRNEGDRLDRCLRSVRGWRRVYVDSGSSDGSPDRARHAGVELIALDPATGFSAARGRNAGLDRLIDDPSIRYIQMLDGDCVLDPGWIAHGAAALDADPGLGAVFGRLRERQADASIYSWLCDVEWATPAGPAPVFAGIVLLRADAVRATGRYRAGMIAGEDPEYALRMRAAGWRILSLATPMATHESAIGRFGQWWRRSVRAGHAFAELNALHPASALHDHARNRSRILFWGGLVPLIALAGLALGATIDPRWLLLGLAALATVAAQFVRIVLRERARHGSRRAVALAFFLTVGKYAEMIGLIRFHRRRRQPPALIEYKTP